MGPTSNGAQCKLMLPGDEGEIPFALYFPPNSVVFQPADLPRKSLVKTFHR